MGKQIGRFTMSGEPKPIPAPVKPVVEEAKIPFTEPATKPTEDLKPASKDTPKDDTGLPDKSNTVVIIFVIIGVVVLLIIVALVIYFIRKSNHKKVLASRRVQDKDS